MRPTIIAAARTHPLRDQAQRDRAHSGPRRRRGMRTRGRAIEASVVLGNEPEFHNGSFQTAEQNR